MLLCPDKWPETLAQLLYSDDDYAADWLEAGIELLSDVYRASDIVDALPRLSWEGLLIAVSMRQRREKYTLHQ